MLSSVISAPELDIHGINFLFFIVKSFKHQLIAYLVARFAMEVAEQSVRIAMAVEVLNGTLN